MNYYTDRTTSSVSGTQSHKLWMAQVTMEMLMDFDIDSAVIKPKYHQQLATVANYLRDNESLTATIASQAIRLPQRKMYLPDISQRRADNIVNYLVNVERIARSRLTAEGLAHAQMVQINNLEAHQENVRINIMFSYNNA